MRTFGLCLAGLLAVACPVTANPPLVIQQPAPILSYRAPAFYYWQQPFRVLQAPLQIQQLAYPQPMQAELSPDCCAAILAELRQLRAEVAALRGGPAPPPVLIPPPVPTGPVSFVTECRGCHNPAVAPEKRGNFNLFGVDSKELPLSLQHKAKVRDRIRGDHPQKYSDEQKAALLKLLDGGG